MRILGDLGEPGGREHLETALMLFEATDELWGIASSQNNLGVESYYEGDWNEALRRYGLALDGFVRIGDETSHATMLNNIAEIHSDQGHWDLARQGFAVFVLDNRGSANRGLDFEAAIHLNMGDIEVRDQAAGVRWLVEQGLSLIHISEPTRPY